MAGISSLGVGSGIFTNDLLNQLVQAERAPAKLRLDEKQSQAEASDPFAVTRRGGVLE